MTSDFKTTRSVLASDSFVQRELFSSRLDETVSLADVAGRSVTALGFKAEGSLLDTLDAVALARETGRTEDLNFLQKPFLGLDANRKGDLLTEEEIETVRSNDPALAEQLTPGKDTTVSLEIKQRRVEQDRKTARILGARPGFAGGAAAFTGAILGSVPEPVNFASGLGVGGVARGVGFGVARAGVHSARVAKAANRLREASSKTFARVPGGERVAGLAAMDTAASVPAISLGLSNTDFTGREYTFEDATVDIFASMAIGRVFDTLVPFGLEKIARRQVPLEKRVDAVQANYESFLKGQRLDSVQPLTATIAAEHLPEFGSVRTDRQKPVVRQLEDGSYESRYRDTSGLSADLRGRGVTPEAAAADLFDKVDSPARIADETGLSPGAVLGLQRASEMTRPVETIDDLTNIEFSRFREELGRLGADQKKLESALELRRRNQQRVRDAKESLQKEPESADAKKELVNAKQAERRANRKLDGLFQEDEKYRQAFNTVLTDNQTRLSSANSLRTGAIRAEQSKVTEGAENLLRVSALDPDSPEARSYDMDPLIQNFNPQEIVSQASQAPAPGVRVGAAGRDANARARQELEAELEDPLITREDKKQIRQELEDADADRQRNKFMDGLKRCIGGRNG